MSRCRLPLGKRRTLSERHRDPTVFREKRAKKIAVLSRSCQGRPEAFRGAVAAFLSRAT